MQVGDRIGRLTLTRNLGTQGPPHYFRKWEVQCDCGEHREVFQTSLHTQRSCGCDAAARQATANRTHGRSASGYLYDAWVSMKQRCLNPGSRDFHKYGARGITVCDRWLNDFPTFAADVGERPGPKWSLDRIDNDGPYKPGNVRWALPVLQARNTRVALTLTHAGVTKRLGDWADDLGCSPQTLRTRLHLGWSVHRALTTPVPRRPDPKAPIPAS